MFVGKVIGTVVSSCKEQNLLSQKLMIVQDLHDNGTNRSLIAADAVGSGVGDIVLVIVEGAGARQAVNSAEAPINAAIVGIVDNADGY